LPQGFCLPLPKLSSRNQILVDSMIKLLKHLEYCITAAV